MNLEPKVTSKGLWWDGQYGGAGKDGKFVMFYLKPNLSDIIPAYDTLRCFPAAAASSNVTTLNGVSRGLNNAEITAIDALIDTIFPDAGGGGGGGGGSGGEADVAHRVRVFGLSVKEGTNAQVLTFPADAVGREFLIELAGMEGSSSNVAFNKQEHYFTLPIMVNAYITYNGFITSALPITWGDQSTWVRFRVDVYTRLSGTAWPSTPSSTGTVDLGQGPDVNVQFYSKQWIDANMAGPQDVQMRLTVLSAPAGFDMTKVTFGRVGWGTTYSLSSCAVKNPDLVTV